MNTIVFQKNRSRPINITNIPITKEELEKRERRYNRLIQLGIEPTLITIEEEHENPYVIEALSYIFEDKDVPDVLIKKIKEYEFEESNKT